MDAKSPLFNRLMLTLLCMVAVLAAGRQANGAEARYARTAGHFIVYLGIMPGELISGPPAAAPGATPFHPPAAKDTHHIMVSIFDVHGRRTTDAIVEARVASLGFSGTKKTLESSTVLGAPVYAGFFPMLGRGPFRVSVDFRLPQAERAQRVTFYFSHPRFTPPKRNNQHGREPK